MATAANQLLIDQRRRQKRQTAGNVLMNSLLGGSGGPGGTVPINNTTTNNNYGMNPNNPSNQMQQVSCQPPLPSSQQQQQPTPPTGPKKKPSTAQPRPKVTVKPKGIGPIYEYNDNDVLAGRGGRINAHPGNVQFRDIIARRKNNYLDPNTKKLEKAHIAADIVYNIRALNPSGRFLKQESDGGWWDIGDQKAIKKTGQALREESSDAVKGDNSDDNSDDDNKVGGQSPKGNHISPKTGQQQQNGGTNKAIISSADMKKMTIDQSPTPPLFVSSNEVMKPSPLLQTSSYPMESQQQQQHQLPTRPSQPLPNNATSSKPMSNLVPIAQVQLPYGQMMMSHNTPDHGMMNPPSNVPTNAATAVTTTTTTTTSTGGGGGIGTTSGTGPNRYFKNIVPRGFIPRASGGGISGAAQAMMHEPAELFGKNFHPPAEIASSMISGVSSALTDQMSCLSFTGSDSGIRGVTVGGGEQQQQQQREKMFPTSSATTTTLSSQLIAPNEAGIGESLTLSNIQNAIGKAKTEKDFRISSLTMPNASYFDDSWTNGPMNHSLAGGGFTRDDSFLYSSTHSNRQRQQPGYYNNSNNNDINPQQQQQQQQYYPQGQPMQQQQYNPNDHPYQQNQQQHMNFHGQPDWMDNASIYSGMSVAMKDIGDDITITSDYDTDQVPMMDNSSTRMKTSNRSSNPNQSFGNSLTSSGVASFVHRSMMPGMNQYNNSNNRGSGLQQYQQQQYISSGASIASLSINEGDNISVADSVISDLSANIGALDLASYSEASYYRSIARQPQYHQHQQQQQQYEHQQQQQQQQQHLNNRLGGMNYPHNGNDQLYGNMNTMHPPLMPQQHASYNNNNNDNEMKQSLANNNTSNNQHHVENSINSDDNNSVTNFALYGGREMLEM